jgi:hypothetical protein
MTIRRLVIVCCVGLLAIAGAIVIYRSRDRSEESTQPPALAANDLSVPGPARLPDYLEAPGVVSKRFGSLRLYVAVQSEIPILKTAAGQAPEGEVLDRVPIRIVLENETYHPLNMTRDVKAGEDLFTVAVRRVDSGAEREVFATRQSSLEASDWTPAERKTFTIDWPLQEAIAGNYLILVTPGFDDRSTIQIRTTLK